MAEILASDSWKIGLCFLVLVLGPVSRAMVHLANIAARVLAMLLRGSGCEFVVDACVHPCVCLLVPNICVGFVFVALILDMVFGRFFFLAQRLLGLAGHD